MTDNEVKWFLLGKLLRRNLMAGVKDEQWETLFEGDVTTEFNSTTQTNRYQSDLKILEGNADGTAMRLTINGVSREYTLHSGAMWFYVGNMYMFAYTENDDGFDLYVEEYGLTPRYAAFTTRNPGTYKVKIERMVS